jgi:hypothetical protein
MNSAAVMWIGLLTAPAAWFLNLQATFAMAPLACSAAGKGPLYTFSGAALVLTLVGGFFAWTFWRSGADPLKNERPAVAARKRAMGVAGISLSALAFITIVAQTIPTVMMAGCE